LVYAFSYVYGRMDAYVYEVLELRYISEAEMYILMAFSVMIVMWVFIWS